MSESDTDKNKLREWVDQMDQSHRRQLMQILAEDTTLVQATSVDMAAAQLRQIADERGLSWETLSEPDREQFLDLLIREDAEATQANVGLHLTYRKTICLQCGRDLTPHDLYRIYFSHRPPSTGLVAGKLLLVDSEVPQVQFSIPPESEILIGRLDPNRGIRPEVDLSSHDPAARVSRKHARILVRAGQFFIEDLGSANGTFINNRIRLRPQQLHALESGDLIRIGQTTLQFLTARG
ncbi:MAG: FHA domain-containing protein [Acidobacteriota bacterium]